MVPDIEVEPVRVEIDPRPPGGGNYPPPVRVFPVEGALHEERRAYGPRYVLGGALGPGALDDYPHRLRRALSVLHYHLGHNSGRLGHRLLELPVIGACESDRRIPELPVCENQHGVVGRCIAVHYYLVEGIIDGVSERLSQRPSRDVYVREYIGKHGRHVRHYHPRALTDYANCPRPPADADL